MLVFQASPATSLYSCIADVFLYQSSLTHNEEDDIA